MFQQTCDGGLFSAPAFLQLERLAPQQPPQHLYQPPQTQPYRSPAEESPPKIASQSSKTARAHPYQRPVESPFQTLPFEGGPQSMKQDGQGGGEKEEVEEEEEEEVVSESEMHVVRAAPGSVVCETGAWRKNGTTRKVVKPVQYVPVEMVEDDSDSESGSDTSTDVAEALKDVDDAVIETDDEEAAANVPDEDDADFVTNEVDESDPSYHESDEEEEEEEEEASSSEEEEEEAEFSGESSD